MADSLEQSLFQFRQAAKPFLALGKLDEACTALLGFVQRESELKKAIASLTEQKTTLEAEVARVSGELKDKLAALHTEVTGTIENYTARRETALKDTQSAEATAKDKVAQAAKEAAAADRKLSQLQAEYDAAVAKLKKQYEKVKAEETAALEQEVAQLTKKRDALAGEISALKDRVSQA